MSVLEDIKAIIDNAQKILIVTHENPDGDAIGSSLGFMHGLRKLDKDVTVYIPSVNKMYDFLPGSDEIRHELGEDETFDVCVALDSSDIERLGEGKLWFEKAEKTIVIDHHITNQNYGDANYVNAVACSTCQNIIVVLASMEVAINKIMGTCIYAGMLTDTGGFRYNVQSETFEFVSMLLEAGIEIAPIYRNLFDLTTESRTRLLGRALERLEVLENGKITFTYVIKADEAEFNCQDGDYENIVNYGRNIEGVEVSIFFREKSEGSIKVSLRANDYVDVSIIASKYAGGGHLRAAGFEISGTLEQAKNIVIDEIKKQIQ